MKISVGGSISMTLITKPYEPVKVESTLFVEEDVKEDENIEELHSEYEAKVNRLLEKDLNNKMKAALKKQKEFRDNLAKLDGGY